MELKIMHKKMGKKREKIEIPLSHKKLASLCINTHQTPNTHIKNIIQEQ